MNSSEPANKTIVDQSALYVKNLEESNAVQCQDEAKTLDLKKKKTFKHESKVAKDECTKQVDQGKETIKQSNELRDLASKVVHKKDELIRSLDLDAEKLKIEMANFEGLNKSFAQRKTDVNAFKSVELDEFVSLAEVPKWEAHRNFLMQQHLQLSDKLVEIKTLMEKVAQQRELVEQKRAESAPHLEKLAIIQKQRDELRIGRLQKEELIEKLLVDLNDKKMEVEAKVEKYSKELQMFERGHVSEEEPLFDVKAEVERICSEIGYKEFIEGRLKSRPNNRKVFDDKIAKKKKEEDTVRSNIEMLKAKYDDVAGIHEKQEAEKKQLEYEIEMAKKDLENLNEEEALSKQMELEAKEALKKQTSVANTPEIRPDSSTPMPPKKEPPVIVKQQNVVFQKPAPPPPVNLVKKGRPKKEQVSKKKQVKRPWEDSDSDEF